MLGSSEILNGAIMTRLLLLASVLALAACTVDENGNFVSAEPGTASPARMSQAGTCFAFVTAEAGGTYMLTTGIGDGTRTPMGVQKTGLSAKAVDAAFAKERAIMDINPECLGVYAKDRAAAKPAA